MRRKTDNDEQAGYWPAVADSFLAALMIVMLLAFGGLVLFTLNPNSSESQLVRLEHVFADLQRRYAALAVENQRLAAEAERLRNQRRPDEPPIIELTDAQNVNFESGKAQISQTFSEQLCNNDFPRLRAIIDDHPTVDTIEIIGHTDDSPIGSARSNLDSALSAAIAGTLDTRVLTAGSNADLGLMRAVAVEVEWRRWLALSKIALPRQIALRCYSAANAIPPQGAAGLSKKVRDEKARRIEIRFTQLKKSAPE